jgi:arginase
VGVRRKSKRLRAAKECGVISQPTPAFVPNRRPVTRVEVIGVPMDLGADRRGVDMGPSAIRYARLKECLERLGIDVTDRGNLRVPVPESATIAEQNAKYFPIIKAVCEELAGMVREVIGAGGFPLVLGGDHSIAMGTIAGVARARGKAPGVIWVDAHGDINTPLTSPSGNVHGMPVHFALQEHAVDPSRMVFIGLRDVDDGEKRVIHELGVKAFTMSDVDRRGMSSVVDEALTIVAKGENSVHVSFDMDGVDPQEAPGVGTPVRGGLTYRESHLLMEGVAQSGTLGSLEITEINPILDSENRTAILAVELILSALGKTTL